LSLIKALPDHGKFGYACSHENSHRLLFSHRFGDICFRPIGAADIGDAECRASEDRKGQRARRAGYGLRDRGSGRQCNVVSVGDVTGPDSVCPSVARADVIALREAARAAAPNAKFAAGDMATTIPLNIDFPARKPREQNGEDKHYTAATELPMKGDKPADDSGNSGVPTSGASAVPKQISGGVLNGKAISLPKPSYPPAARAVRASGAVNIQVLIIEDGTVFSASAVSGHPLLRAAAREAACGASFSPTSLMGNPVKVSGVITYNFVP